MIMARNGNKFEWLPWLSSVSAVLAGLAALFYFFPELPAGSRVSRPFVPQIRFIPESHDINERDWRLVLSPALITLPSGVIHPAFENHRVDRVMPPGGGALDAPVLFLDRTPGLQYSKYSDVFVSGPDIGARTLRLSRFADKHIFERSGAETSGIRAFFSGGLNETSIEGLQFAMDKWSGHEAPWAVTLYVRFNQDGLPVNVFVESPARHDALNKYAVRMVYQLRMVRAEDPVEGRITIFRLPEPDGAE